MKISVIIPVYNAEQYLNRCLDACLNQTVSDFELILVNDGSTDSSLQIIENYAAKHSNVVCLSVENGGQGRARNRALDIATGEYIGFVDADDYPAENMYEIMLNACIDNDADMAVCNYYRFEGDSFKFEPACYQNHPLSCAGAVWNKLFKRDLIADLRFPESLWYEDFSFSARMLLRSKKTVFVDDALYNYRSDNVSTMRNSNALKNLDMIKIMEEIKQVIPDGKEEYFNFLLINNVLLDTISRVAKIESSQRKAVIQELLDYVHEQIPDLFKCESYRNESKNRRIIMKLNYDGREDLAQIILKAKSMV